MNIADELREYALGWDERNRVRRDLRAIADRIDAAVDGMIELPKDADNVPWSVGDRDEDGNVVTELRLTSDGWFVITDGEWPYQHKRKRHHHDHHTPNVEDVLCDLLNEYRENECTLEEARLSEYAAKMRLAEGED